jgi:hypothetical protein
MGSPFSTLECQGKPKVNTHASSLFVGRDGAAGKRIFGQPSLHQKQSQLLAVRFILTV